MRVNLNAVLTGLNNPTRQKLNGSTMSTSRQDINGVLRIMKLIVSSQLKTRVLNRPSVTYSLAGATCPLGLTTGVVNGTTITINGVVMTATQFRASGTVTMAAAAGADTVTVNGVVFTAVTTLAATNDFLIAGSNNSCCTDFVRAVNASPTSGVFGLIGAKNLTAVATIYAITGGTAGNAYTLASSNGTRLAVSGATLSGGTTQADNAFDFVASPAINAADVVSQIAASTSALISSQVVASQRSGTVTCVSVLPSQYVLLNGAKLVGTSQSTLTTSATQIAGRNPNLFETSGTDTNTGSALAACINSHPVLAERFWALGASGAVQIIEKAPILTQQAPTLSSSNGTSLAVTGTTAGLMIDGSTVLVQAINPGVSGNCQTIATSSSALITVNSQTRLIGGTATTQTF